MEIRNLQSWVVMEYKKSSNDRHIGGAKGKKTNWYNNLVIMYLFVFHDPAMLFTYSTPIPKRNTYVYINIMTKEYNCTVEKLHTNHDLHYWNQYALVIFLHVAHVSISSMFLWKAGSLKVQFDIHLSPIYKNSACYNFQGHNMWNYYEKKNPTI